MKKSLFQSNGTFYKANLHTHSTISDGKLSPEQVKQAYLEKGYSIVAFSDHEVLIPHPELCDGRFLPLTSIEIEFKDFFNKEIPAPCKQVYHLVMLASDSAETHYPWANRAVVWGNAKNYVQDYCQGSHDRMPTVENVNAGIRGAKEHGFLVTYCHPGWSLNHYPDYCGIEGADFVEVFNSACVWSGRPDDVAEHTFWDFLCLNKPVSPTCSDDSHGLGTVGHGATYVKADSLTYENVIRSLKCGDTFASTGPRFKDIAFDPETCVVTVESDPVEVISITTNIRTAKKAGMLERELVTEGAFDLSEFVKVTRDYGIFDRSFFRVNLFGPGGKRAYSRGYFLRDLF